MNDSPVFELFEKYLKFDIAETQPIYVQVAQQIINIIQRGFLKKGTNLKSISSQKNNPYSYAKKTGFPFQKSFHLASTIQTDPMKALIRYFKPNCVII